MHAIRRDHHTAVEAGHDPMFCKRLSFGCTRDGKFECRRLTVGTPTNELIHFVGACIRQIEAPQQRVPH